MPISRSGRVKVEQNKPEGMWAVTVRLDENDGQRGQEHDAYLGSFREEPLARQYGDRIVARWEAGENVLAEIGMKPLVARYRAHHEKHRRNSPQPEPASREAWELQIDDLERMGEISAQDADIYRRNVAISFGRVK